MSLELYEKARRLGVKAYRNSISNGTYPYLPVLDDIIRSEDIVSEVNLGLVDIPLDRVVGTSTSARTQAFASNFMPLMDVNTEFGFKWSSLSEAHLEEGIRDAIKVYEYLNYYYVVEGNKRVSVLKYYEADSIPAFVTRKVPKLTDDEQIKIYYEYMDFNKKTGINSIWFSREGSFKRLIDEVNESVKKSEQEESETVVSAVGTVSDSADGSGIAFRAEESKIWSEDTVLELKAAYRRFQKAFKDKGGEKLEQLTTGDAFLLFLEVEGFDKTCEMSIEEMTAGIIAMWQEFLVANENSEVEVSLDPPETKKNVIKQILTPNYSAARPLKTAFLYGKEPESSDWSYAHELGRNHIKEVFGDKISTIKITVPDIEAEAVTAIEDVIENQGVEVIFTTSARMVDASLKCAIKYPDVKILNCSLNTSHRYIRTYYARLYEAKFLSGIIAGALTNTNKIGYLADYPIFGITANINAFAIGARMVNPDVKVYLRWTTLKDADHRSDISRDLYLQGIDYLSDQDMITPKRADRRFGLYKLSEGDPVNEIMPVYNWGILYEKLINIIMEGNWGSVDADSESKPINYWWGLSSGVVDIIESGKVPVDTARLVGIMKELIIEDRFSPFGGEIYSQDGVKRNEEGNRLSTEDIITMDWLVDNVVGEIPEIEELKDKAKPIVELKGVRG